MPQPENMLIAILGATSQIAKDLVQSFAANSRHDLMLFARRPDAVTQWLAGVGLVGRYAVADFAAFSTDRHFDAILNFVGVGNPVQAAVMGASIFDVTLQYDELALSYVRQHPTCRYIFMSSGAAYGSSFETPADANTKAVVDINYLQPEEWYGVAKLQAECRHRSLAHLPVVDIRIFNYFSHTQDIEARFLITDILRAIRDKKILQISADYIVRDFIHPSDFYQLVCLMLAAPLSTNTVVDCYSKSPIEKPTLLEMIQDKFGLRFEATNHIASVNATGKKPYYYSLNKRAGNFGYLPAMTSADGLLQECQAALKGVRQ